MKKKRNATYLTTLKSKRMSKAAKLLKKNKKILHYALVSQLLCLTKNLAAGYCYFNPKNIIFKKIR
jgi:hypothetical protein